MKYAYGILLAFLILFIGCREKNQSDPVNGHWHIVSYPDDHQAFTTLDISDTVVTTQKFVLDPFEYYEIPRIYESKNILPFDIYSYSHSYKVNGDTLIIHKDSLNTKYVRHNLRTCVLNHRYSNVNLTVELASENNAIPFEEIPKHYCATNVFIGYVGRSDNAYRDSLSKVFPDSTFVQVNDVWINFSDLENFYNQITDICSPKSSSIYLHIDKRVKEKFVHEMISYTPNPDDFNFFRVVKMQSGDIGIAEL